ncbi:nucleotide exchange factor GrpE [Streptomyces sp. 15-116A]|uniref:nucleotide exchange factor GrpE n=1 Tax=Streptomyces sp. 15-116A TaxID=2259035 RepID=UPI0021B3CAA0|nr:nucleotide exchange factor GrpE [Streptomyces sp. 15-116A]MCT7354227.1 nucleotide exchange factor GrpE [Streptomyces sp. 15-116A]
MDQDGLRTSDPARLRRLLEERTADLQRVKAEYDNYRKRVARDRVAVRTVAAANVVRALLPVLDAVDRTCAHEPMTPGLRDIADTLRTQLGSLGLESFGKAGAPFDPTCHEAAAYQIDPDATHMTCTKILRPGYRLTDELLRPAYVEVTGPPPPPRTAHAPDSGGTHQDEDPLAGHAPAPREQRGGRGLADRPAGRHPTPAHPVIHGPWPDS